MNKRPTILVTNDDGMFAPGIKQLVAVASKFGEVIVVAPDSPQSAKGHALTLSAPIRLREVDVFGDIRAYECSGTPVDCVKLAKNVLLKDTTIDLCLSGINHGSNASLNILYSGTMSAAMEASIEGVDSIGFSLLDYSFEADMKAAQPYMETIIKYVLDRTLDGFKLLNVNIPAIPREEIKGLRVCRQAEGRWVEEFQEGKDPRGVPYYWLTGKFECDDMAEDTDIWALENGYISIVPSLHDLTDYKAMKNIADIESVKI